MYLFPWPQRLALTGQLRATRRLTYLKRVLHNAVLQMLAGEGFLVSNMYLIMLRQYVGSGLCMYRWSVMAVSLISHLVKATKSNSDHKNTPLYEAKEGQNFN